MALVLVSLALIFCTLPILIIILASATRLRTLLRDSSSHLVAAVKGFVAEGVSETHRTGQKSG